MKQAWTKWRWRFVFLFGSLWFLPTLMLAATTSTNDGTSATTTLITSTTTTTFSTTTTTLPTSLRIEGLTSTLFVSAIDLPDSCYVTPTATTTAALITGSKAICALQTLQEQNQLTYQTTKWSFGFSLDQINNIANAADWSQTWILYKNNISAAAGIGDLTVTSTDELLLTYGSWPMSPLSLTITTTTPRVGDSVTATTSHYTDSGLAAPLLTTTTFSTNTSTTTTASGIFSWIPTATGTVSVWTEATNKTRSKKINVFVQEAIITTPAAATSTTSTPPNTGTQSSSSGTGSNSSGSSNSTTVSTTAPILISLADITSTTNKILTCLKSQQDSAGKIVDGGMTVWSTMSLGSAGQYAADITTTTTSLADALLTLQITSSTDPNPCAGYPRHVLGLLAGGLDATMQINTLLEKITGLECYDNHLYGKPGINDDVFALLALLATGTSKDTPIIQNIVTTLKNDQTAAGAFTYTGWVAPDITGAAVNALKYAEQKGVAVSSTIYASAKTYLRSQQLADGGWGYGSSDVLTTSWAMMGINALGEGQADWTTSTGKNPWYPLVNQLRPAGYYESSWAPDTVDWFGTKHAVPALLGKSWPIILAAKQTPNQTPNQTPSRAQTSGSTSSDGGSSSSIPVTAATSTISTPFAAPVTPTTTVSSTPPITASATTTLAISDQPSLTINNQSPPVGGIPPTAGQSAIRQREATREPEPEPRPLPKVESQPSAEQLIAAPASPAPIQSSARKVFGTATAMAGTLGAYLAWRFLQTIV